MKDTEVKDLSYYRVNKAEATEKTKWCFEKFNVEEEKILEEINVKGKYAGDIVEALYPKDTKIVDVINRKNCVNASYIYLRDRQI